MAKKDATPNTTATPKATVAPKVEGPLQLIEGFHQQGKAIGYPAQYHAGTQDKMHTPVLPAQIYEYHGKGEATLLIHNGETPLLKKAMLHTGNGKPAPGSWVLL